ncbi:MAG: hypothetical protein ACYCOU_06375 [Sulfobacillus sp.]
MPLDRDDYLALKEARELIGESELPARRKRCQADRNAAYMAAVKQHQECCHPRGGFLKETRANYDPGYCGSGR